MTQLNDNMQAILFYAFRYVLGRSTYAVLDVVEEIVRYWGCLAQRHKDLMVKEIKEAIEKERYGMEIDKDQWMRILQLEKEDQQ